MKARLRGLLIGTVVVGLTGASAAAYILQDRDSREVSRIDALNSEEPGPLDGLVFSGMLGPDGQPKDVADTFVFENGNFLSKECELRCDYPARPYTALQTDDGWAFSSTTRCPYKDATIVWRGTVKGDRIDGIATWTVRRWYWTVERDFAFEASLQSTPIVTDTTD